MPINATIEYFKAEERFKNAKTTEEKILYLEEMIREAPSHKGGENLRALLKTKLAKLRKDAASAKKKKGGGKKGISKQGEAQVCLLGKTMSGKSTIIRKLTEAKPQLASHEYTTIRPEVGMMSYEGVQIQLVEIPSTWEPENLSITRTSDLILFVVKSDNDKKDMIKFKEDRYIRVPHIFANASEGSDELKEKIWSALDFMIVYTKDGKRISPMALKHGSILKDFAVRIHKDFVKDFRFAQVWRKMYGKQTRIQAGLDYPLKDRDIVEIHLR